MNFLENFKNKNLIIAHRGFRNFYVENSLEALINSSKNSDFIELDIQFTKDYTPIIHHDETLERMSDIHMYQNYKDLKPWYIKDFNYNEIEKLDIKGTNISTLEEFLGIAKKKEIYFNLEIKQMSKNTNKNEAIDIIINLIEKYNCTKYVLFSSFNHKYLKLINKYNKKYAIAVLDEDIKRKNILSYLKDLNAQTYNINKELVKEELIIELRKEGIETLVYTVNDKKIIDELFKIGVKGVFTDYPYE